MFYQETLALWAFDKFHLLKPNQSTASGIKTATRPCLFLLHSTNATLMEFVESWSQHCIPGSMPNFMHAGVRMEVIIAKAKRLQHLMNSYLPRQKQTNLSFNAGWLSSFQKRWNLKGIKSHSESGNADQAAIDSKITSLRRTIKLFKDCFQYRRFWTFLPHSPRPHDSDREITRS